MNSHTISLNEILVSQIADLNALLNDENRHLVFEIDCLKMPSIDEFKFDERKLGCLGNLFTTLDELSSHCLYWFELENEELSRQIDLDFRSYKSKYRKGHDRNVPALNKVESSKVLYLGVRRGGARKKDGFTNFAGRIYHHLGYYRHGSTQGLQLVHWYKGKLELHVIEFPNMAKHYLNILEKLFAMEFKPLIGKH